MNSEAKALAALTGLTVIFLALAGMFLLQPSGSSALRLPPIALVDTNYLDTATVRRSYADLVRAKEDLSDFECYVCHEKGTPPQLRYDTNQNLIIPKEHPDIVMGHGSHGRNNNCFNCHNETNLELLQTRDGQEIKFTDSPALCGSCHGPTYRDWEASAHGRTSGYWNRTLGAADRKACVNCHNPHSPRFPGRHPAPGPHLLHSTAAALPEPTVRHLAFAPSGPEGGTPNDLPIGFMAGRPNRTNQDPDAGAPVGGLRIPIRGFQIAAASAKMETSH